MGLFNKTPEQKEAAESLRSAKRALDANAASERRAGIRDETAEYQRLNRAVLDAEDAAKKAR